MEFDCQGCQACRNGEPRTPGTSMVSAFSSRFSGVCGLNGFLRKLVDENLSTFFHWNQDDLDIDITKGRISLRRAVLKSELFDDLHVPVSVKAGFVKQLSIKFDINLWQLKDGVIEITLKDVGLLFAPQFTDWDYESVVNSRTKLIELMMKIVELPQDFQTNQEVRTTAVGSTNADENCFIGFQKKTYDNFMSVFDAEKGPFSSLQRNLLKTLLSMIKVNIHNVHVRYEDSSTQHAPFAFGFKVGHAVNMRPFLEMEEDAHEISQASVELSRELRATGDWKHWNQQHSVPLVRQSIDIRRISAYWDVGSQRMRELRPVGTHQDGELFASINRREFFVSTVVQHLLTRFPPEHSRRKYAPGPRYRERFDYHRFLIFPFALSLDVSVNQGTAVDLQHAPTFDVDIECDAVEAAIDSEQLRSLMELNGRIADFQIRDSIIRTRPRYRISTFLSDDRVLQSPVRPILTGDVVEIEDCARRDVVKAWWIHAFSAVCVICKIKRSGETANERLYRRDLEQEYMEAFFASTKATMPRTINRATSSSPERLQFRCDSFTSKLQDMELKMDLLKIRDLRIQAKSYQHNGHSNAYVDLARQMHPLDEHLSTEQSATCDTLQLRTCVKSLQVHFLVDQSKFYNMLRHCGLLRPGTREVNSPRDLVMTAQVLEIGTALVQKPLAGGKSLAKWIEFGMRDCRVINQSVKKVDAPRHDFLEFQNFGLHNGSPLCFFVGMNILNVNDPNFDAGCASLAGFLEPWHGVKAHLHTERHSETNVLVDGWHPRASNVLQSNYKYDGNGTFIGVLHWHIGTATVNLFAPFVRRMRSLVQADQRSSTAGGSLSQTVERHKASHVRSANETLPDLDVAIKDVCGKLKLVAIAHGIFEGGSAKCFEDYNRQQLVVSELSFAPMRCRVLKNRDGTLQSNYFHLPSSDGDLVSPPNLNSERSDVAPLPTKATLCFVSKEQFVLQHFDQEAYLLVGKTDRRDRIKSGVASKPPPAIVKEISGGEEFVKWGRSGKPLKRWVYYDAATESIVWKPTKADPKSKAVSLRDLRDIVVGVHTPVLHSVRSRLLRPDLVFSLVFEERTLDLQPVDVLVQRRWTSALKLEHEHVFQKVDHAITGERKKHVKAAIYPQKYRSLKRGLLEMTEMSSRTPTKTPTGQSMKT